MANRLLPRRRLQRRGRPLRTLRTSAPAGGTTACPGERYRRCRDRPATPDRTTPDAAGPPPQRQAFGPTPPPLGGPSDRGPGSAAQGVATTAAGPPSRSARE